MKRRVFNSGLAAAGLSNLLSRMAVAQAAWPNRMVKIIVPFPAGGTADAVPRIVADRLGPIWKQPIIIENRSGAAGSIGTAQVVSAKPDGYTLLAAPPPPIAINQHLYAHLSYDPAQLRAVTVMGAAPNVVAVSNKFGVNSVHELIERARERPGDINAANQGVGTTSHLTAALFETLAGVRFNHVPYSGTAPAMTDLIAGHVDVFFDNLASSLRQHQAGKIKIVAVCSAERAPQLPDVPTVSETTLSGFSAVAWYAIMAPPGTPDAIIHSVSKDVASVIRQADVHKKLMDQATTPIASSPEEAAAYIAAESQLWGGVIKRAGLKLAE
jgi:tripartite-type tricarboxylate transporter receptor subunit TctC